MQDSTHEKRNDEKKTSKRNSKKENVTYEFHTPSPKMSEKNSQTMSSLRQYEC